MKNAFIKWGLICYSFGLILVVVASYSSFLTTYGGGGVPKYENGRYILFNHGRVTNISEGYFELIEKTQSFEKIVYFLAFPLLLVGIIAYLIKTKHIKMNLRIKMWLAMFIPQNYDYFVAILAKIYCLFTFIIMFFFNIITISIKVEKHFIFVIFSAYFIGFIFSYAVTLMLRRRFEKNKVL